MERPRANNRPDLPLAVVVGAGNMGMAVARRLGLQYRLLLADRDEHHLVDCQSMLEQEGHDIRTMRCDVTHAADVEALGATAQAIGPVLALAHVAGLSVGTADFRTILSVNLLGPAMMAATFHPILAPHGCALFISSSAAHMRSMADHLLPLIDDPLQPGFLDALQAESGGDCDPGDAYFFSKIAVNRLCRREAARWGKANLRIVSLSPGLIATPMGAEAYKQSPIKQSLFEAIPVRREGTILEVANVAAFLLSNQASYISGTDILVDGGLVANLQ